MTIITGQLNLQKSLSIAKGEIIAVIPNTKPIFAILEPITLPKEISEKPSKAAFKLTINSGAEVAKETTVKPITILESLSLQDNPTEDLTKNSPPTTKKRNPRNK